VTVSRTNCDGTGDPLTSINADGGMRRNQRRSRRVRMLDFASKRTWRPVSEMDLRWSLGNSKEIMISILRDKIQKSLHESSKPGKQLLSHSFLPEKGLTQEQTDYKLTDL